MNTNIIILAQGEQKRMGDLAHPKQMLPLPGCQNATIIERTLMMLQRLTSNYTVVTVVSGKALRDHLFNATGSAWTAPVAPGLDARPYELPDAGNSSLRGISRVLRDRAEVNTTAFGGGRYPSHRDIKHHFDRTVVLLGDVVYSWRCLENLISIAQVSGTVGALFCGTRNLSTSVGEIWGLTYLRTDEAEMLFALAAALKKHPPFEDTYQPGQLRRWYWEINNGVTSPGRNYAVVDDYTMDVDLPVHIEWLKAASEAAALDDAAHGIRWFGHGG